MKKSAGQIEATPSKRLYFSIIADYDLNRAICELIDNALDIWMKNHRANPINVDIDIDSDLQTIRVCDNAGGVKETLLSDVVAPGQTSNEPSEETIGIFGVGTKRAVIALAKNIKITTRYKRDKTFQIEIDEGWLTTDSWLLPKNEVDNISDGATVIELYNLRIPISQSLLVQLKEHLRATYAKFLANTSVKIQLNKERVSPLYFEDWAYPPHNPPRRFTGELTIQNGERIKVDILAGLTTVSSPAGGEYGVYFYCNNRLVARALRSYDVGFIKGLAGQPHPSASLMRVIVSLNGPAQLMPWNSSKSNINPNHKVFIELRKQIIEIVKHYSSLSKRLSGRWQTEVFDYPTGKIIENKIDNFDILTKLHLPPLPKARLRYGEKLKQKNRTISRKKPWVVGLYESIVAVDLIFNQNLEQKNRISLILLDSTLEIAFKEYLVNESGKFYSTQKLFNIFSERHKVENEIKNFVTIHIDLWRKVRHYYDLRCKLVHERATSAITDPQVEDYRDVVKKILKILFKLQF